MKISLTQFLKHSTVTLLGLGLATGPANAVSITTTDNGNTLVDTILGQGITASNVKYIGASLASGTFTDGLSSGIGIDSGIILTTGNANLAVGPNKVSSAGSSNGTPGDANLNSLLPSGGSTTRDASILEMDFTTTGGDLYFNYVFASEEYNEFANTGYNDVFGFFLDGKNIGLIPGTTTPVSINTVNGGYPLGTNAKNSQFFKNNSGSAPSFNTQYDGFTTPFTAQATGIGSGTHKLKLAIADVGDARYDTAVFIQGSSVATVPVEPGLPVEPSLPPIEPGTPAEPVPEPSSILGTLMFGAFFGTSLVLKGKQKRKQTQQA